MTGEEMTVSWRTLLQMACAQVAEAEMEALPTPEGLMALYPDMAAVDRRVLSAVAEARRAKKKKKRPALRAIRRVLIAAAVGISLLFCTLMTNAAVRGAVVDTILEWTSRDLGIRFVLEGEPLSALPEGYGPHYIPEGLVLDEENSWQQSDGSFFYTYANADGSEYLDIQAGIAQNGSAYWMDNEHTEFQTILFMDTTAYLGRQQSIQGHESYVMVWVDNGIEHYVRSSLQLSELMQVAENIC